MTMLKPPNPIRVLLALLTLAAIAVAASGCGTSTANVNHGRILFVQKCGVCHTLAQAGTTAQIGPNLDDAFAAARAAGEGGETFEGIVKAQVEFPRPSTGNPDNSMPADVVTGQDLEDVAAYVGRYAGVPGAAPGGTVGPNLDEALPGQSAAMVKESIADPNAKIVKGYPANVMPQNFAQTLTSKELEDLVQYLLQSTKSGGGSKSKGG